MMNRLAFKRLKEIWTQIISNRSEDGKSTKLLISVVLTANRTPPPRWPRELSSVNEMLAELPSTGTASMHTLQRHREILQGYRQEFNKICANHTTRMEREELLRGSGLSSSGTLSNPTTSGLSRRDMYLKESGHIMNSHNMVNDQISIALETKEHLLSQRHSFKRLQTRFNDISNRFPLISSLLTRINIKKRRDSLILGAVIGVCTVLLLLYAFH